MMSSAPAQCHDHLFFHNEPGTWITSSMIMAYQKLHELGYAHSIEVSRGQKLIGGIYGISILKFFCRIYVFL